MGRPKGSRNKEHATHCKNGHPRVPENLTSSGGCLECHKVAASESYERNKEITKERAKKWSKDNPKRRNVIQRESRQRHAEARRQTQREYISSHPEVRKKKNKALAEWKKENPERCRALENKRRAAKTSAGGFFTAEEWFTLCFSVGFRCMCCGEKKPLEADHVVPISKGGTSWLWNIQPLCKSCNTSKKDKIIDYRV